MDRNTKIGFSHSVPQSPVPSRKRANGGSKWVEILIGAGLSAAAGLIPVLALWGFTVDDALITARVAHHVGSGVGYRFNAGGPPADAVTPLGWAYFVAALGGGSVWSSWLASRFLSVAAWLAALAWLGTRMAGLGKSRWRWAPLVVLAASAQPAAWAVSGMETGVVALLATLGLARSRWAWLPLGWAAAWRPELIPWALVLGAGGELARSRSRSGLLLAAAAVLAPALVVALVRGFVFGNAVPMAAEAKPSDLDHGLAYVFTGVLQPTIFHGGAVPLCGAVWLVMAPWAWPRLSRHSQGVLGAALVHAVVLVLAGGDWMVLHRLWIPIWPGLFLVGAEIFESQSYRWRLPALCIGLGVALLVLVGVGPTARGVGAHRARLIDDAAPFLAHSEPVAALDVGWVGAVTDGEVVDLAGVTDRAVAGLPGGHTSKHLPPHFLENRGVRRLVVLLAPGARAVEPISLIPVTRAVEHRALIEAEALGFQVAGEVPLGGTAQRYAFLVRPPFPAPP